MTNEDWNEKYQKLMRTLHRRGVLQFVVTDKLYESILELSKINNENQSDEGPLVWIEGPNGEKIELPEEEPWDGQTLDFRGRKILRRRDLKPEDSVYDLDTHRTEEEVAERYGVLGQD